MSEVFRNRAFSYLWFGKPVLGMGSALTALASTNLVFWLTGSALSVGLNLIFSRIEALGIKPAP